MFRPLRGVAPLLMLTTLTMTAACQSPTDPDANPDVDDFLAVSVTPSPAIAQESTDNKTYRVVRGNNQPDDILAFDWKTSFTIRLTLNDKADDEDYLTFPVDLTSATLKVQQASGGIVSAPTGGDVEHYDYVISNASANRFAGVNSSVETTFDVWYDLPSLRREALISVTVTFRDDDDVTFTKTIDVRVAP